MTGEYQITTKKKLSRMALRTCFRLIFHVLAEVQIKGREFIPRNGPYVVAMNHVSIYDPPFLLSFWPTAAEAVAASDIWSKPGQSMIVRLYGAIPVHRGVIDREAVQTYINILKAGRPLVIAPEGGRSHVPGMRKGLPGIAYLTDQVPVPIIPVGITGTTDDFFERARRGKRPRLIMNIGKPLQLPPITGAGADRRAARQHNVDLILSHVAALLPPEYRGVYDSPNLEPTG